MKLAASQGVHAMMKPLLFVLGIAAACGPKGQTSVSNAGGDDPPGPVKDTRTELERRRDTACETLGPRITECALASAKAELANGQLSQKDYDEITKPEIKAKHTQEFIKNCSSAEYSSRQVRVLEVCQREESECEPMLACLDNLDAQ